MTEGVATSNEVVDYLEKEFRSLSTSEPSGTACQAWRSHKAPVEHWGDLRQWMFQAAQAGCLTCVRYYMMQKQVELNSTSEEGWSVIEHAMRGVREGRAGAADVLRYLRELGALNAEYMPESAFEGIVCASGRIHKPSAAERRDLKYFMFQAAYEGCVECVKAYISVKRVNVQSTSEHRCFTMLDWAKEGVRKT